MGRPLPAPQRPHESLWPVFHQHVGSAVRLQISEHFSRRDDGVAYWGEWIGQNGGQLKWQVGVFNGQGRESAGNDWPLAPATSPNPNGDPTFTAHVLVNLLDPEPDYYNFSTYYGEKNILAIGFAVQTQQDAVTDTAHHVGSSLAGTSISSPRTS